MEKVNHEPALMDRWLCKIFKRLTFRFFARFLLKLGVFFVIVYTCFTITVGVFTNDHVIPGGVHIANGVLELVAVTLQIILIFILLAKVS